MMYQRQVGFGEAISRAFSNYCNFSGRASRSEFWWFALFNYLVAMAIYSPNIYFVILGRGYSVGIQIVYYLYCLAVLLPSLGLTWRRLHDIGKAGGWYFIGLIPIVGAIILLVWLCKDSEPCENRFGSVPNVVSQDGPGF